MNAQPEPSAAPPPPDAPSAVGNIPPAQVRALAEAVQLYPPPERIDALTRSFSDFLTGFAEIRVLDTGDREPATLTHREETKT